MLEPALPDFPSVFRLESITWKHQEDRTAQGLATLWHHRAHLSVAWTVRQPDLRLKPGVLVGVRWKAFPQSLNGQIQIARLVLLERPIPSLNLFETIPYNWVRDRNLVDQGRTLLEGLPRHFQALFNAIFWEGARFQRYCIGPSSMQGHHAERNGNLRHSLEVARQMRSLCAERDFAHLGVGVLAALLHDAGKADEYRRGMDGKLTLSDRGRLVGHRWTVLEWIAAARARWNILVPEREHLSLVHALTSSAYAPEWTGLRAPTTPEATLLSLADRLSGSDALMSRCAPEGEGWGRYHPHLKGRPFMLLEEVAG